jgi:hypothetical protein
MKVLRLIWHSFRFLGAMVFVFALLAGILAFVMSAFAFAVWAGLRTFEILSGQAVFPL